MSRPPDGVLFVCSLNRVRSPMAAGLAARLYGEALRADSCGVRPSDDIDPLAAAVMAEMGVEIFDHQPKAFADFDTTAFELVVALSEDAAAAVRAAGLVETEHWPVDDPTVEEGSREMRLEAFRQTRRDLERMIVERLGPPPEWE